MRGAERGQVVDVAAYALKHEDIDGMDFDAVLNNLDDAVFNNLDELAH